MTGQTISNFTIPFVLAIAIVEWIYTRRKGRRSHDADETVASLLLSGFALAFEVGLRIAAFALYKALALKSPIGEWSLTWPVFLLTFVFSDFLAYLAHRVCHEMNVFWATHLVHHQPKVMNLTVAFRTSLTQRFVNIGLGFAAAVLNLPFDFYFTSLSIITVYAFWCHTETIGRIPFYEWIFVTPSHHRVHHAKNPRYLDKNYGNVFIIWDRLFGTFVEEDEKPVYGITQNLRQESVYSSYFQYPIEILRSLRCRRLAEKLFLLFGSPTRIGERYAVSPFPSFREKDSSDRRIEARSLVSSFIPPWVFFAGFVVLYPAGIYALSRLSRFTPAAWGTREVAEFSVASVAVAALFYLALRSFRRGRMGVSMSSS